MSSNLNPNESTRKLNLKEVRRIFLQLYPSVASQSAASWSIGGGSGFSSLLENFAEKVGFRSARSSFVWKSRILSMMMLMVVDSIWWVTDSVPDFWMRRRRCLNVGGHWSLEAHKPDTFILLFDCILCWLFLQLINCKNVRTCICTTLDLFGSNQPTLDWNSVY